MAAIAKFGAVSLDSRDAIGLGRFYRQLLDFETLTETDELVVLRGKGVTLTVERVDDHRPPIWPGNTVPKQMHLDLFVADLDEAERAALDIGAVKADYQPSPQKWRVLLDPAGHPFCLVLLPPRT